jgi:hypothetical protein
MRRLLLVLTLFFIGAVTSSHADSRHDESRRPDDRNGVSMVLDANGKPVGRLVSYGRNDGVFLTVNGVPSGFRSRW